MARIILICLSVLLFSYCSKQTYEIDAVCEVTELYNYVVKWDTYPVMEGNVRIYTSFDPDSFNTDYPYKIVPISDGMAELMIKGSLRRRYFLLKFDEEHEVVVGVKNQTFETVYNYRDFGGIQTEDGKKIKWGKLYRSGNLDEISDINARRIAYMRINTWIDLRIGGMTEKMNSEMNIGTYHNIPMSLDVDVDIIRSKLFGRRMSKDGAVEEIKDVLKSIQTRTESLKKVFFLLKDPNCYPVIISCDYGLVQTSVFSSLLMHVLGVPDYTIIEEYELNNKYFDMTRFSKKYKNLPSDVQDVLTSFVVGDPRYIEGVFANLVEQYGSVDNYITNEIGLTQEDVEKIRENVLQ